MQSIHNWFVLGYGSVNITVNLTHYNKNSKQFIVLYFNEALSTQAIAMARPGVNRTI